jgi:hypothetical protein
MLELFEIVLAHILDLIKNLNFIKKVKKDMWTKGLTANKCLEIWMSICVLCIEFA